MRVCLAGCGHLEQLERGECSVILARSVLLRNLGLRGKAGVIVLDAQGRDQLWRARRVSAHTRIARQSWDRCATGVKGKALT